MLKRSLVLLGCVLLAASLYGSSSFAIDPGTYRGRTIIKSFGEHRIGISVDANGEFATHVFRFWSEESLKTFDATYPTANVEFTGKELIVTIPEAQTILHFGIGRAEVDPHDVPEGFGSTSFAGYGLNHEIHPNGPKRAGGPTAVTPYLDCEPNCDEPIFEWPGDSALDCTAGGEGATSCSLTSAGQSCAASCGSGYWACCKRTFAGVSCSCVRR